MNINLPQRGNEAKGNQYVGIAEFERKEDVDKVIDALNNTMFNNGREEVSIHHLMYSHNIQGFN